MEQKAEWLRYFDELKPEDQRTIAIAAIERLMDIGEVRFRVDDVVDLEGNEIPDDEEMGEMLYWESCGEDLRTTV